MSHVRLKALALALAACLSGRFGMPSSAIRSYTVITQWKLSIELTPEQAVDFANKTLTAVRVNIGGETYQLALRDGETMRNNMRELTAAPK